VWDLESKQPVSDLNKNFADFQPSATDPNAVIAAISLAWSADGMTLFAGYTDNKIRVWEVAR